MEVSSKAKRCNPEPLLMLYAVTGLGCSSPDSDRTRHQLGHVVRQATTYHMREDTGDFARSTYRIYRAGAAYPRDIYGDLRAVTWRMSVVSFSQASSGACPAPLSCYK